ncbi:Do family serine endopeptidase [Lichenibacterium dinghuense]|uniref:Do family serine endopeptidase n=1 Tax=Lichenibacterium dinghuense TaxID=2895977 RepID=UPI001F031911|nr:Do family serine endopeptidase [Lichenibacterium sp. 6Y81]
MPFALSSPAGRLGAVALALAALATAPARAKGTDSLADLAASVTDAVVNISAAQVTEERQASAAPKPAPGTPLDDLFQDFFKRQLQKKGDKGGDDDAPRGRRANSLGSGFIVDPAGIVITNNHVIEGANDITVILTDGTKLKAEVVGKDSKVDVAVLKVKPAHPLPAVPFGDSDKMRVGDPVMAVGNPFGLGGTVTAGIVSARNRNIDNGPYDNYIQTDAAINKGNSGGPLFDMKGEVIGINTAILSPTGGSIGLGFATPSDTVLPIIDQLREFHEARRGWLGVRIQPVTDDIAEALSLGAPHGALIAGIDENGPAGPAGLKKGDVIVRFDGHDVHESRDLPKFVASAPVGKDVTVSILRDGKPQDLTVKLGRLDAPVKANAAVGAAVEPPKPAVSQAFGLGFVPLDEAFRKRYGVKDTVKGVAVTTVDPGSPAADKLKAGDVVVEVNQVGVDDPADAAAKIRAVKDAGKKTALLLVSNAGGDVRYVALSVN